MDALINTAEGRIVATSSLPFTQRRVRDLTGISTGVRSGPIGDTPFVIAPVVVQAASPLDLQGVAHSAATLVDGAPTVVQTAEDVGLDVARATLRQRIDARAADAVAAGVPLPAGHVSDIDAAARQWITNIRGLLAEMPTLTSVEWRARDDAYVDLPIADFNAMALAIGGRAAQIENRKAELYRAVAAAADVAALRALDIESGWAVEGAAP